MHKLSVIFGLSGFSLTQKEKYFFKEVNPWAFILFKRNVLNKKQLIKQLKKDSGFAKLLKLQKLVTEPSDSLITRLVLALSAISKDSISGTPAALKLPRIIEILAKDDLLTKLPKRGIFKTILCHNRLSL